MPRRGRHGAWTRRRFLGALGGAACTLVLSASQDPAAQPRLLWAEEFDALDVGPTARWRANDVWQSPGQGYPDFGSGGHSTWCANPAQQLGGTRLDPFSVHEGVLRIEVIRTPPELLAEVAQCPWIGGILISNTNHPEATFSYGYYEFRARVAPGRGMFPGLWLYAAHGQNPPAKAGAEIDVFEVFGDAGGSPGVASVHLVDSRGEGSGGPVASYATDPGTWHTYGTHWTPDVLRFYYDRREVGGASPAQAQWLRGCRMSVRLDYVMDAAIFDAEHRSDADTPDRLVLEVDYVRRYDRPFS